MVDNLYFLMLLRNAANLQSKWDPFLVKNENTFYLKDPDGGKFDSLRRKKAIFLKGHKQLAASKRKPEWEAISTRQILYCHALHTV